jgi:hypothetical protein
LKVSTLLSLLHLRHIQPFDYCRWSVGERFLKEQGSGTATLLIADYSATHKQDFPRCGSSITPVHAAADFQWKDYAPAVFK